MQEVPTFSSKNRHLRGGPRREMHPLLLPQELITIKGHLAFYNEVGSSHSIGPKYSLIIILSGGQWKDKKKKSVPMLEENIER